MEMPELTVRIAGVDELTAALNRLAAALEDRPQVSGRGPKASEMLSADEIRRTAEVLRKREDV